MSDLEMNTTVYGANVVQGEIVEENENAIEEEFNEEYDGDYQDYTPIYANYSSEPESITQKFLKKKKLVILVLCTVGVAIGISVHFKMTSNPTSATTTAMTTTTTSYITRDLLTACSGNPCQNGGTCTSLSSGDIQVCFIINVESGTKWTVQMGESGRS